MGMTGTGREPKLEIGGRCLAVFVDETGHEELKGQPVYGLGGCAALGRDIERLLDTSWREVRRRVAGSPNAQLRANGLRPKPGDVEAIEAFFRTHHFWRLGAVITRTTKLPDELSRVRMMKGVLQNRVKEIVGRSLCKEVAVIFESSQRTDRLIEEAFQDFEVARGSKRIPSTCYFMPKSAAARRWKLRISSCTPCTDKRAVALTREGRLSRTSVLCFTQPIQRW